MDESTIDFGATGRATQDGAADDPAPARRRRPTADHTPACRPDLPIGSLDLTAFATPRLSLGGTTGREPARDYGPLLRACWLWLEGP